MFLLLPKDLTIIFYFIFMILPIFVRTYTCINLTLLQFGHFKSGSDIYLVQQSTNSSVENSEPALHVVTKLPVKMIPLNDDVIQPGECTSE